MNYLLSPRLKAASIVEVLNIAHRGARAYAPENTLLSFTKAKAFDCQMVELDVRLSKDAILMVFHDESLTRCTDVRSKFPGLKSYNLADFTYPQLSQLDAAYGYVRQLALPRNKRDGFMQFLTAEEELLYISSEERAIYRAGTTIPTLVQVLELAQTLSLLVNIELKNQPTNDNQLADQVVALVQAMSMQGKVLISSFEWKLLKRVHDLDTSIATGVLTEQLIDDPIEVLQDLGASAYHICGCYLEDSDSASIDFKMLRALKRKGFGINVCAYNRKVEISQLIKSGATGIISDFPNRVRDVLLN